MKKISFLLIVVCMLTLISCKQETPLVELTSHKTVYSSDVEKITVTWNNYSDETFYFGRLFTLDKKEKGEWVKVEPNTEDYAFTLDMLGVTPNKTTQLDYPMYMYTPLEKGEYRIVADWRNGHFKKGNFVTTKKGTIYFEFEIE